MKDRAARRGVFRRGLAPEGRGPGPRDAPRPASARPWCPGTASSIPPSRPPPARPARAPSWTLAPDSPRLPDPRGGRPIPRSPEAESVAAGAYAAVELLAQAVEACPCGRSEDGSHRRRPQGRRGPARRDSPCAPFSDRSASMPGGDRIGGGVGLRVLAADAGRPPRLCRATKPPRRERPVNRVDDGTCVASVTCGRFPRRLHAGVLLSWRGRSNRIGSAPCGVSQAR